MTRSLYGKSMEKHTKKYGIQEVVGMVRSACRPVRTRCALGAWLSLAANGLLPLLPSSPLVRRRGSAEGEMRSAGGMRRRMEDEVRCARISCFSPLSLVFFSCIIRSPREAKQQTRLVGLVGLVARPVRKLIVHRSGCQTTSDRCRNREKSYRCGMPWNSSIG